MLDDVDRALIHALHIDGRAPFSRIAAVLDVSPQTVSRRYQRLRTQEYLRVVGLADPRSFGEAQWLVRLTADAGAAQDLAYTLARRVDTSWVRLTSGGTEIVAIIHNSTSADGHPLLLRDIPRTASITAVSAHYLLHTYRGGHSAWRGSTSVLDDRQQRQLTQWIRADAAASGDPRQPLTDIDSELLAVLQQDGRTSHAGLAAATGWSAATVARRLIDLQASGAIYFDVEIDPALFGVTTQALLWASVVPAHLDQVATTLASHAEIAFVAATTGPTNLVAHALCADPGELHQYLIHRLGALGTVHTVETAPVLQTLKAASPIARADPASRGLTVITGRAPWQGERTG